MTEPSPNTRTTPPQESPSFKGYYAGFSTRLIAFAIDILIPITIMGIANGIALLVLNFFNITVSELASPSQDIGTFPQIFRLLGLGIWFTLGFLFFYGYFIFFWMINGQTPGKMIMGVRVLSTNGRPLTFWQSVRRLIGYWVSMIVFFLGFFWVLISDTRQGWHDKIANTYVIYTWQARPNFPLFRRLVQVADKRDQLYGEGAATSQPENEASVES